MRRGKIGFDMQRLGEAIDCLVMPIEVFEDGAQIEIHLGNVGFDLQRLGVAIDCSVETSQPGVGSA